MAIYHCSTKPISRAAGRSATASSAYRSGSKVLDSKTGEIHDYTRKQGVVSSEIIPPKNLNNLEIDRSELWSKAELSENRKDARVAREFIIALPHELSQEKREEVAKDFAKYLADRYQVVADLAIHEPSKNGNDKNHHAHIMITTRKCEIGEDGKIQLSAKTDLELNNTKRKSIGLGTTHDEIKEIRKEWGEIANKVLKKEGIDSTIDHRSFEDQGLNLLPTIHEGVAVTAQRRNGNIVGVAKLNDEIKEENSLIKSHLFEQEKNRRPGFFEKVGIKKVVVKEIIGEKIIPISSIIEKIDSDIQKITEEKNNDVTELNQAIRLEEKEQIKKTHMKIARLLRDDVGKEYINFYNEKVLKVDSEAPTKNPYMVLKSFDAYNDKKIKSSSDFREVSQRNYFKVVITNTLKDEIHVIKNMGISKTEVEDLSSKVITFENIQKEKAERLERIEANKKADAKKTARILQNKKIEEEKNKTIAEREKAREAEKTEKFEPEPTVEPEKIKQADIAAQDLEPVAKQPEPEIDDDWDFVDR